MCERECWCCGLVRSEIYFYDSRRVKATAKAEDALQEVCVCACERGRVRACVRERAGRGLVPSEILLCCCFRRGMGSSYIKVSDM